MRIQSEIEIDVQELEKHCEHSIGISDPWEIQYAILKFYFADIVRFSRKLKIDIQTKLKQMHNQRS